jgi:uncharacterized protein YgiM (DUF1202 family)
MMRFCIQCGVKLAASSRFCGNCGAPVPQQADDLEASHAAQTGPELDFPPDSEAISGVTVPAEDLAASNSAETQSIVHDARLARSQQAPESGDAAFEALSNGTTAKNRPNWLLIGGGVAMLLLLLLYYLIFISDDVGGNPALPAQPTKTEKKSDDAIAKQYFAMAQANIRDKPTTLGSNITGKLARGSSVTGKIILGEDGTSEWLELTDGQGYIGMVNLSQQERPAIIKALGDVNWTADQQIEIWSEPTASATLIDRVQPGTVLALFGLTANDYIEIKLKKGGVGYIADGTRIAALATVTGKPIAISFNPSSCNFGGELEAEFEKLSTRVRAAYDAADKADYPDDAAREKALARLEGKSTFQRLQRSFNGLTITAIAQHYESQAIYFADPPEKVTAVFRKAGHTIGKDGAFRSGELSASIGRPVGEGSKFGKSDIECGA